MVGPKIAQVYERAYEIALNPKHPEHCMPPVPSHVREVLDVGCGAGAQLAAICAASPFVVKCVGVDSDEQAIAFGWKRWPGLTLFALHGEDMFMMARCYDLVMSRFGLPYMDIPRVLALMVRGVRPYGRVWLATYTWKKPARDLFRAVVTLDFKQAARALYVLENGLWFHLTGRLFSLDDCPESFQTERRMRQLMRDAGCVGITYTRHGVYAVITAEGK